MTSEKFVSSIKFAIIFPEDFDSSIDFSEAFLKIKNNTYSLFKEFGYNNIFQYNDTCDFFKAKSNDYILESLKQRTKFVLKRINEENNIKIISYKIKSIILDSSLSDSLFPLKGNL
jgi:replication-associated recombination protein RarA